MGASGVHGPSYYEAAASPGTPPGPGRVPAQVEGRRGSISGKVAPLGVQGVGVHGPSYYEAAAALPSGSSPRQALQLDVDGRRGSISGRVVSLGGEGGSLHGPSYYAATLASPGASPRHAQLLEMEPGSRNRTASFSGGRVVPLGGEGGSLHGPSYYAATPASPGASPRHAQLLEMEPGSRSRTASFSGGRVVPLGGEGGSLHGPSYYAATPASPGASPRHAQLLEMEPGSRSRTASFSGGRVVPLGGEGGSVHGPSYYAATAPSGRSPRHTLQQSALDVDGRSGSISGRVAPLSVEGGGLHAPSYYEPADASMVGSPRQPGRAQQQVLAVEPGSRSRTASFTGGRVMPLPGGGEGGRGGSLHAPSYYSSISSKQQVDLGLGAPVRVYSFSGALPAGTEASPPSSPRNSGHGFPESFSSKCNRLQAMLGMDSILAAAQQRAGDGSGARGGRSQQGPPGPSHPTSPGYPGNADAARYSPTDFFRLSVSSAGGTSAAGGQRGGSLHTSRSGPLTAALAGVEEREGEVWWTNSLHATPAGSDDDEEEEGNEEAAHPVGVETVWEQASRGGEGEDDGGRRRISRKSSEKLQPLQKSSEKLRPLSAILSLRQQQQQLLSGGGGSELGVEGRSYSLPGGSWAETGRAAVALQPLQPAMRGFRLAGSGDVGGGSGRGASGGGSAVWWTNSVASVIPVSDQATGPDEGGGQGGSGGRGFATAPSPFSPALRRVRRPPSKAASMPAGFLNTHRAAPATMSPSLLGIDFGALAQSPSSPGAPPQFCSAPLVQGPTPVSPRSGLLGVGARSRLSRETSSSSLSTPTSPPPLPLAPSSPVSLLPVSPRAAEAVGAARSPDQLQPLQPLGVRWDLPATSAGAGMGAEDASSSSEVARDRGRRWVTPCPPPRACWPPALLTTSCMLATSPAHHLMSACWPPALLTTS